MTKHAHMGLFKGKDYLLICGFMELVDKAILGNNKRNRERERERECVFVCVFVCACVSVPTCACPLIYSSGSQSRSHCFPKGASRQCLKTQVSQL